MFLHREKEKQMAVGDLQVEGGWLWFSIHLFTPQTAARARVQFIQSQEPSSFQISRMGAGDQDLVPHSAAFPGSMQGLDGSGAAGP